MSKSDTQVKLNEFDQDEWWDVCRIARPDLTREKFDGMWSEFVTMKRKKQLS